MKRFLALILCLLMTVGLFGCGESDDRVAVTEDGKKIVTVLTEPALEKHVEAIVRDSAEELADVQVEIEVMPYEPAEREAALSRIRAEIIAGEGPDVFAVTTGTQLLMYNGNIVGPEESLFTDVEASMELNIFLPMDEYLSGEYLKFDEHFEVLMDSGRTDEGLEVLPLTYVYTTYLMDKTKIDGNYTDFSSLEAMKNCTDERLRNFLGLQCSGFAPAYFTDLINYEKGELNLSLEEFREIVLEFDSISSWYTQTYSEEEGLPGNSLFFDYFDVRGWNDNFDSKLPIVPPNMTGGITANVTSIIAVNRNCINKAEAVRFAELFFCSESQRVESRANVLGMDTRKTIFAVREGTPVEEFLHENAERISFVRYGARMDETIQQLINKLHDAEESEKDGLITDAYNKMQMMAAE